MKQQERMNETIQKRPSPPWTRPARTKIVVLFHDVFWLQRGREIPHSMIIDIKTGRMDQY